VASVLVLRPFSAFWPHANWSDSKKNLLRRFFALGPICARSECGKKYGSTGAGVREREYGNGSKGAGVREREYGSTGTGVREQEYGNGSKGTGVREYGNRSAGTDIYAG